MVDEHPSEVQGLAAGDFSPWVLEMQAAIRDEAGSNVPCGGCTACCTSSQFVHIAPDETDTLSRIPVELLFPAPRQPSGHVLLGYDDRGFCPMLIDGQCSIYAHRPRACRTYDCRVFPAAGVELHEDDKVLIARQARRWQFGFPSEDDRDRYNAVRAAATFLDEHRDLLPDDAVVTNETQRAVLAIEVHDAFLPRAELTERDAHVEIPPDPATVVAAIRQLATDTVAGVEATHRDRSAT
jgi:Fe-S-cluster containining protein